MIEHVAKDMETFAPSVFQGEDGMVDCAKAVRHYDEKGEFQMERKFRVGSTWPERNHEAASPFH